MCQPWCHPPEGSRSSCCHSSWPDSKVTGRPEPTADPPPRTQQGRQIHGSLYDTPAEKGQILGDGIRAVQLGAQGALEVELGNNSLEVCTMLWNSICIFVRPRKCGKVNKFPDCGCQSAPVPLTLTEQTTLSSL